MKKIPFLFVVLLSFFACNTQKPINITNPLDVAFGDPFVLPASDG
jgi:hypothetical protein